MSESALERPGFYVCHEAWYASVRGIADPELMVGDYPEDGGTAGEFGIRWRDLGSYRAARIEAYYDSWEVLKEMDFKYGLLGCLVELGDHPEPDDVVALLRGLGFQDLTDRQGPQQDERESLRVSALAKLTRGEKVALGLHDDGAILRGLLKMRDSIRPPTATGRPPETERPARNPKTEENR